MRHRSAVVGIAVLLATSVLVGCDLLWAPRSVDFMVSAFEGTAPLAVEFVPYVDGAPTSYAWDFGDGRASNEPKPVHVYTDTGTYSVSLTVGFGDHKPVCVVKQDLVDVHPPLPGASPSYLYWVVEQGSAIKRGSPVGEGAEQLASQWYFPAALAIGGGKVFWVTNRDYDATIDYMDLDGSNRHAFALVEHNAAMLGIAVDSRNEKVYWTSVQDHGDCALRRADLDLTNVETLTVYAAGSNMHAEQVVVDPESEIVYWSEIARIGSSYRAMLMASSTRGFAPHDVMELVGPPRSMALDTLPEFGARKLYYTAGSDELRCASLDGTSDIVTLSSLREPWGVAVDAYTGRIYFGTDDGIFYADDGIEVIALYPDEVGVRSVVLVQ